jgi:hypothetical protein
MCEKNNKIIRMSFRIRGIWDDPWWSICDSDLTLFTHKFIYLLSNRLEQVK